MANKLDRLQSQFQLGGQTVRTSAEEAQGLAARSGRQAPPTQPLETSVIGGTPSQAKMAGSSANITNATRMSLEGTQRLPDYLRKLQATMPLTEAEGQRISRARAMGNLNSMEERVQAAAVATLANTGPARLIVNENELPSTLIDDPNAPTPITKRTDTIALLNKFGQGTNLTQDEWSTLVTNLGYSADTRSIADIKADIRGKYFKSAQDSLAAAATGAPNDVLLSSLNPSDLGMQDWEQLRSLLKIDPSVNISTMTVKQLTDQVNKVQAEEYSRTAALIRILNDPNVAPRDKEAARMQLAQLGASGIMAAEVEVDAVANQVADINTITIDGKDYTISELLSDKTITSLIDDYLNDPIRAKSIKDAAPAFATWIDNNKLDLQKYMDKLDPGIKQVADIVENNAKLQTPDGVTKLNNAVMSTLFGADWSSSTKLLVKPPIFTTIETYPNTQVRQDLTRLLNSLSNRPEDLNYLKGLSAAALEEKGLLSSQGIQRYQSYIETSKDIAGPFSESTTTSGIVSALFGDDTDMAKFEELLQQVKIINDTNLVDDLTPDELEVLKIFDSNQDGIIDNTKDILKRAQGMFSGKSLRDLVKGANDIKSGSELLAALKQKVEKATTENELYNLLGGKQGVLADGKIGDDEIDKIKSLNFDVPTLETILNKNIPGVSKLQKVLDERIVSEIDDNISGLGLTTGRDFFLGKRKFEDSMYEELKDKIIPAFQQVKDKLHPSVRNKFGAMITQASRKALETLAQNKIKYYNEQKPIVTQAYRNSKLAKNKANDTAYMNQQAWRLASEKYDNLILGLGPAGWLPKNPDTTTATPATDSTKPIPGGIAGYESSEDTLRRRVESAVAAARRALGKL